MSTPGLTPMERALLDRSTEFEAEESKREALGDEIDRLRSELAQQRKEVADSRDKLDRLLYLATPPSSNGLFR